jgi:hypothetical protein
MYSPGPNVQGYIDNRHRGLAYDNLDKLKWEVAALMMKYEVEPNARCGSC